MSPSVPARLGVGTVLTALASLAVATPGVGAQTERPRVAIALAGGAAKGIAHVGVLRWLEEHRIPVDYVAGTSMGGLVGGVYATGRSAADVHAVLRAIDWDQLFVGDVPYALKSFRRKEDRRSFPARPELGLRGGLRLASGLESGNGVGLLLSRLVLPYSALESFDALPVPFRCVATDIERAESVVLGEGSLAQALRATMAIPALFTPVSRDGRLLVDGGLMNNLPVDVAAAMGADVVIAVQLPTKREVEELSLLGMAGRALDVMLGESSKRNLARADVVVVPDIESYESSDWSLVDEIAEAGYRAAEQRAAELLWLALDQREWEEHLAARRARVLPEPSRPDFVEVAGIPERAALELGAQLADRWAGRPLDLDAVEADLSLTVGTGRYESALYELVRENQREGLRVLIQEEHHSPPFVNFSADIRSQADELVFNFGARMTALDLAGLGSELRADGLVGSTVGAQLELYRPVGRSAIFLAPRLFASRESSNVFEDDALVANVRSERSGLGIDLGVAGGRRGEVRAGYQLSHLDAQARVGEPGLPEVSGQEERFELRIGFDTLDNGPLPGRGLRVAASGQWYTRAPDVEGGDAEPFPLLAGALIAAWPAVGRDTLLLDLRGGTALDGAPPSPYSFALGGPFRLGAFEEDEFRGRHFVYGSVSYLKAIGRLPSFVGGGIFLVGGLEVGSAFDRAREAELRGDVTFGAVVDTVLGPVFAGGAVGSGGRARVYVSIGASFPFRGDLGQGRDLFR